VPSVGTHTLQRLYSSTALYSLYSSTAQHPLQYTTLYLQRDLQQHPSVVCLSEARGWDEELPNQRCPVHASEGIAAGFPTRAARRQKRSAGRGRASAIQQFRTRHLGDNESRLSSPGWGVVLTFTFRIYLEYNPDWTSSRSSSPSGVAIHRRRRGRLSKGLYGSTKRCRAAHLRRRSQAVRL
jgi:hypothetical protein